MKLILIYFFSQRLRRGLVERSLWVTVLLCFGIIAVLTAAVIYYKIEADHLREGKYLSLK